MGTCTLMTILHCNLSKFSATEGIQAIYCICTKTWWSSTFSEKPQDSLIEKFTNLLVLPEHFFFFLNWKGHFPFTFQRYAWKCYYKYKSLVMIYLYYLLYEEKWISKSFYLHFRVYGRADKMTISSSSFFLKEKKKAVRQNKQTNLCLYGSFSLAREVIVISRSLWTEIHKLS